jgi:hypothetical protein
MRKVAQKRIRNLNVFRKVGDKAKIRIVKRDSGRCQY